MPPSFGPFRTVDAICYVSFVEHLIYFLSVGVSICLLIPLHKYGVVQNVIIWMMVVCAFLYIGSIGRNLGEEHIVFYCIHVYDVNCVHFPLPWWLPSYFLDICFRCTSVVHCGIGIARRFGRCKRQTRRGDFWTLQALIFMMPGKVLGWRWRLDNVL